MNLVAGITHRLIHEIAHHTNHLDLGMKPLPLGVSTVLLATDYLTMISLIGTVKPGLGCRMKQTRQQVDIAPLVLVQKLHRTRVDSSTKVRAPRWYLQKMRRTSLPCTLPAEQDSLH